MRIAFTKPLFAWDSLEDSPGLHTIRQPLASLPDGQHLQGLRDSRLVLACLDPFRDTG